MSILPERDVGGAASVAAPLRVLDTLPLGAQRSLVVAVDGRDQLYAVPSASAPVGSVVTRALPGDGVAEALVAAMRAGPRRQGAFELVGWRGGAAQGEAAVRVDQTNESVVVGGAAVVKWVVRPSREAHPAPHRLDLLVAGGFTGMPQPWGLLLWHDERWPGSPAVLMASVSEYVAGAQDGWDWAVEDVRAMARGEASLDAAVRPASALGELTARMHLALAAGGSYPASAEEATHWRNRALDDLDAAVSRVDGPEGERLGGLATRARQAMLSLADVAGTPVITVHGDLHVGQVLRRGDEYLVTDFDGNPVLTPTERSLAAPAALDVAGMVQSLDHVGRVVIHRTPDVDAGRVRSWIAQAQRAFLTAYSDGLADGGRHDLLDHRALAAFRVQQECREHLYAVAHLPHWRYVPDAALPDLLDELDRTRG